TTRHLRSPLFPYTTLFRSLVDNAGNQLGELTAVRAQGPFAGKIEAANPENPALSITRGQNSTLTLRNDDPYAYPVNYHFAIYGVDRKSTRLKSPHLPKSYA